MYQKLHEFVVYLDYTAWYYLNTVWHNGFLDAIIPYFRNQWTWAPLYLFLLVFMLKNFGYRGLMWCVFFLATFALSDQLSAHLIKPLFMRVRPCNNPQLAGIVHNIVPCGSGYSFPSSHAANHFALGVFSALTLGHFGKWIWYASLFWAASVAYAQVYVGVHFPLDVTCGGLLGVAVGILTAKLFRLKFDLSAAVVKTRP
jgi:membrane-associated phospholipid phosphatase